VKSGYNVSYDGAVTTTREALIEKLVVALHLSVPERQLLGSDCLSIEEVAAVVKRVLDRLGVFPPHARPWKPGEAVFEGFFLVKRPDGRVEMAWQRAHPIKPTELAEQRRTDCGDIDEAVSMFIDSEWGKGIDGVRLTRRGQPYDPGQ